MKFFSKYLSLAAVAVATGASLTSCQNDFDLPPIDEPKATMEANTTISALKTQYWQDDQNYFLTVGTNAEGADVIVRGRVVSSDATGNIYKSLVIQDETGALAFSINQTGLNNSYRVGQEIVVNLTDLGFGKYAGLQQVGGYGEHNGTPQVSFMDYTLFQSHTELNGFPKPEYKYINPGEARPTDGSMYCLVADMGSLPTTPEGSANGRASSWCSATCTSRAGANFLSRMPMPLPTAHCLMPMAILYWCVTPTTLLSGARHSLPEQAT